MSNLQQIFESALRAHQAGDLPLAESLYRQVLADDPRHADALRLLGMLVRRQGKPEQAVELIRQALHLQPDLVEAHCNLGDALFQLGKLDEATACYKEALARRPDYPDAHNNLGNTLKALGHLEEAIASYRQAIRLQPDFAGANSNLGEALFEVGKTEEALACFQEAIRLRPDYAEAHNSLGNVLIQLGKGDEADHCYREALRSRPDYAEAQFNLCYGLKTQGRPVEAVLCYREALRRYPDHADAHFNLAHTLLLTGDFAAGWPEYEWRWKTKGLSMPVGPRWDGSLLAGRTILLQTEQGLGDTIQFVRYAPLVKNRGGTVVLRCPTALARLLAAAPGIDRLVPSGTPVMADACATLLSLPRLFGTTLANVPAAVPYLTPEPELVERWQQVLGPRSGLRVGIAWQGDPKHRKDGERSVPLRQFAALGRLEGVRLISLQKGFGTEQLAEVAGLFAVTDLGPELDDFADTAAVMANLDLVVTVDSAVAHLAGALGVPVWVLLPFVPDWRWLLDRADSPWYPTMRLFRQGTRGDWPGVFARVSAALREC